MKMRVIVQGSEEFALDAEYAAPAIAAAIISGKPGDVRSEIMDCTDTERSDIDCDEYVIVTEDAAVVWQGWLDSGRQGDPPPAGRAETASAAGIAQAFHEAYERLAPLHGYETREASARPWQDVPAQNRDLMTATVAALLADGVIAPPPAGRDALEQLAAITAERDKYLHQLAEVIRMCEHPEQVAGKTSGSGVVNGRELAHRVLDVIGGAE